MIEIKKEDECCGCSACVQKCPLHCIDLKSNYEGFLYPSVDLQKCVNCNICEASCPIKNVGTSAIPLKTLAFKHPDLEVRRCSTSGGVFSVIAERILSLGGIVFGAMFDENWNVIHGYIEDYKDIDKFRGSKYVQSVMGNSFVLVEKFLKEGKIVLFSGTPCQVRGLKLFLGKDYEHLYCLDFVCHGVPSPMVWKNYLDELKTKLKTNEQNKIKNVSFRDKTYGWSKYSFDIKTSKQNITETLDANPFLRGFIHDLYLRQSCNNCKAKNLSSGSDWTCADTWGGAIIYPDYVDDTGCSTLIVNTNRGSRFIELVPYQFRTIDFSKVASYNKSIYISVPKHRFHDFFYKYHGKVKLKYLVVLILGVNKILRILHL
ncbi:MAG: Coenzyme F420 hydrogenase/dehydrogenase, beta subunit C-terminal domain [Bacteroidales bacterium]|nr:Coenzyme F420 hydrogenase/dehydrogenase, beta subunit C-terminal domain [Bacteroidales bacterium]